MPNIPEEPHKLSTSSSVRSLANYIAAIVSRLKVSMRAPESAKDIHQIALGILSRFTKKY